MPKSESQVIVRFST